MTQMTNSARANRATQALTAYYGEIDECTLTDLLADILHWCDEHEEDFEQSLQQARNHHWAETHGEE